MGFHKRWINKNNILQQYKDGGIDAVKRYFTADALMISDEFSSTILDLLNNKSEIDAIKLLNDESAL